MDDFYQLTHIGVAVLDIHGKVLVATGWQDICTLYHRVHPETRKNCLESDLVLSNSVTPGTFEVYRCKNNMWDMATPIMADGVKVGSLYLGQFFFDDETPDVEVFRQQAWRYGFDEEAYMAALERVPRWSRETVDTVMTFYTKFACMISDLGHSNMQLNQTVAEKETLLDELRHSEGMYRILTDNAAEAVYVAQDGRLKFANPQSERLSGFTREELLSRPFLDFVHPEDRGLVQEEYIQRLQGAGLPATYSFRIISKAGETLWVEPKAAVIEWEGKPATLNFLTDITERKQAEEQYQTLFREMLDGFALHEIICDAQGKPVDYRFLDVNPAFERLTGLKAADIVGRTVLEILPNTEPYWIDTCGQVALTGEPAFLEDYSRELDRHFEVTAYRPAPNQFVSIFVDVTERVRLSAEQKKLQARLQQSQKMEAVGRLAGGVAHDFNNLLTSINGFAELMQLELPPDDPLYAMAGRILGSGQRAAQEVSQLLAFSRRQLIRTQVLDLNDMLQRVIGSARGKLAENIRLQVIGPPDLWSIKADPNQIEQMILNLTGHAQDWMPEGGTLTLETANLCLTGNELGVQDEAPQGDYVALKVSDTGASLSPDARQRVFEPFFFKSDAVADGVGLRLAAAYGIVKQNGGHIWLESQPGQGNTFWVYMPRYVPPNVPPNMPPNEFGA